MKFKINDDKVIRIFAYMVLIFLCVSIVLPFMQVITISVSPAHVVNKTGFHFIPTEFDWGGYKMVFQNSIIWSSYANTIIRTVLGTLISMTILVLAAYPLSRKDIPNRKFWMSLFVFTMYFSGGMIPTYLVVKNLGIMNTMWALVLPMALNVYNLIIMRNFFEGIPLEIEESARLDGATAFQTLFHIILPLSKAVLATVSLWVIVAYWNEWFQCMIYIHDEKLHVVQYTLHKILTAGMEPPPGTVMEASVLPDSVQMAALIVTVVPILCVYPFIQKYFVKGVMLGSVKG